MTSSCDPASTSSGTSIPAPGGTVSIRCASSWCERGLLSAASASAAARSPASAPFVPSSRGLTKSVNSAPEAGIAVCSSRPVSASSIVQRALETGTAPSPASLPRTQVYGSVSPAKAESSTPRRSLTRALKPAITSRRRS